MSAKKDFEDSPPPGSLSPRLTEIPDVPTEEVFARATAVLRAGTSAKPEEMKEVLGLLNEVRIDPRVSESEKQKAEQLLGEIEDRFSMYSNEVYADEVRVLSFKKGNIDAKEKVDINGLLKEEDIFIDTTKVLGSGAFGTVFAGTMKDGRPVAVKQLNPDTSEDDAASFKNEIAIMARIRHPYCCEFVGYLENPDRLVTRRYPTDLLKYTESGTLTVCDKFQLAYQLTSALSYIHSIGLLHRDLKSENVFIDENGNVRVADFGLTQFVPDVVKDKGSPAGTLLFMSPEQLTGQPFSQMTEVYTLGMMLWELFTGRMPFDDVGSVEELIERQKNIPMLPVSWRDYATEPGDTDKPPKEIFDLASTCYAYHPENRPQLPVVMKKIIDIATKYSITRSKTAERFWKGMCNYTYRNRVLLAELINNMKVSMRAPIAQTLQQAVSPQWNLLHISHFWLLCCWFPNFFRNDRAYALLEDIVYADWYCCDDAQAERRLRISGENAFVIRPSTTNPFFEPFTLCLKIKGTVSYHHIIRNNSRCVTFSCDYTGGMEYASLHFLAQYLTKKMGISVASKLTSLAGVYGMK